MLCVSYFIVVKFDLNIYCSNLNVIAFMDNV